MSKDNFSDSFMGLLTGDYSKLAQQSLDKEISQNASKFLLIGLVDKLVELKIISEQDLKKVKLKGKYLYLETLKESLDKKYENIDEGLAKMNEDFCKAYTEIINTKLAEIKELLK